MRVITTSGARNIKIIPRYTQSGTINYQITLYNENTRQSTSLTAFDYEVSTYNTNNGQIEIEISDTYNEGDTFSFKVTDNTNDRVVNRGKIFVTDQTPQNYSINE